MITMPRHGRSPQSHQVYVIFFILLVSSALPAALSWGLKLRQQASRSVAAAGLYLTFGACNPGASFAASAPADWDPNVQVEVLKSGARDAPRPKVGDMVAIRFIGSYQGRPFDDTMSADSPYFYRAGAGSIVKGLDDGVLHMKLGDKLSLSFGGDLGFREGKPSSAGKARIPPGGTIDYIVELVDLPGTAEEDSMILDDL